MLPAHLLLALMWTAYCVLHSVLASPSIKNTFQKIMGKGFRFYRFSYNILAFAGLAGIMAYQINLPSPSLFPASIFTQIAGALAGITGLIIMGICISKYFMQLSGILWLTGDKQESKLIVDTLHKWVRHPLYLGTFLFIWGLFLLIPTLSLLITDIIITVYTLIGIRFEEKKLVKEFGESYIEYRRTVPMILPKWKI
jgi:methanethiol S-methyltransferase